MQDDPAPTSAPRTAARRPWREAFELLASMRFAIALLALICIASIIGTVVRQNEPINNHVNQFGPFWAEVFDSVGLFRIYSAPWFLLILGFLVLSTSLCIARNAPKILADIRNFKEQLREQSLQAFHHKGQALLDGDAAAHLARVDALLAQGGWTARAQARPGGTMVAARKGRWRGLGYLAAHSAIVLVCLGGLADGDLMVRAQMALRGKTPYDGQGRIAEVDPRHRLPATNPGFRGNLMVTEGKRSGVAVLAMPDGVVLQDLPFDVELKKFIVEYYASGMPRLFASEIVIHDGGRATPATVKVNEPVFHRGIAIYQSGFEDGGSALELRGLPLAGSAPFELKGQVGGSAELDAARMGAPTRIEFTGLRVMNVENLGETRAGGGLAATLSTHLGSGAKTATQRELRNVGPSVGYKLRDAAGQAREFHNYMLPVLLDGQRVLLAGVRDTPQEAFHYLRIPADEAGRADTWLRLRHALLDAGAREKAARRWVEMAAPAGQPETAAQMLVTARRALELFAGAVPPKAGQEPGAGLQALGDFVESGVPEAERERVSSLLLRILEGSLFELLNQVREAAGQPRLAAGAEAQSFMTAGLIALSESFSYPAPVIFELAGFQQVQASVFQVARAPGKALVYLGAVLLMLGVFAMLYLRERRLWIWLQAGDPAARTRITLALSTNRRTLAADQEFEQLRRALLQENP